MQIQIIFLGRGAGNYTGGDLFPVTLQCEFKSEPPFQSAHEEVREE